MLWYPRTDAGTRGHNTLPVKRIITIGRAKEQPLLDHCTLGSRLRYEGKCIISKLQTAPPLEDLPSVTLVASTVHLQVMGVLGLVLAPPVVKGGGGRSRGYYTADIRYTFKLNLKFGPGWQVLGHG